MKYDNEQRESLDLLGGWIAAKTFLITWSCRGFPGDRNYQMITSKVRDIDAGVFVFKQKTTENRKPA